MSFSNTDGWRKSADNLEILQRVTRLDISGVIDDGDRKAISTCESLVTLNVNNATFTGRNPEFPDLVLGVVRGSSPEDLATLIVETCSGIGGAPDDSWEVLEGLQDIDFSDCALTEAQVDAILVGLAAAVAGTPGLGSSGTPGTIDLSGTNAARSTASDDAVTALEAAGFTVTTTT